MEGVRLIGGPINRGFTVTSKYSWFLNLCCWEKKACISCFIICDDRFLYSFLYPAVPIYEIHIFIVSAILFFLYRCHFQRHHDMAFILIATTAINSLRVISRWGTDLFPLETQRGPSGRRKKWEGKERKGRKGKGRKKGERAPFILAQFPFPSPPLPFCRLPFRSGKRQPILGILYCLSSDGQLLTVISLLQY